MARRNRWPRIRGGRRLSDAQLAAIHAKGQRYTKARQLISGKPHMTYNPGTGQMEPEDYSLHQRQAPTHVFPKKDSKTGLTKPITFTPKKLHELYVRAGQQFGELPIKSKSGKIYFRGDQERQKKIRRFLDARERRMQERMAKHKGVFKPQESDIEVPVDKRFRIERTPITSVSDTVKYDPQEVLLMGRGSSRPSVTGARGGSPLNRKKGQIPEIAGRTRRGFDPDAIRYRWKDIIETRRRHGVAIKGKPPLKPGLSISDVGKNIKQFPLRKRKADPIEKERIRKEKETLRLRKQALRLHLRQLKQNRQKIVQRRQAQARRLKVRERRDLQKSKQLERKSRWQRFLTRLTGLTSRR